jgi:ATP-binding cassette subfamily C protein CydD
MFDRYLWQRAKVEAALLIATIISAALVGGVVVAQAWLLSTIIAGVFLGGQGLEDVQHQILWFLGAILVRAVLQYTRSTTAGLLSIRVREVLRRELLAAVMDTPALTFQGRSSGETAATLIQGVDQLDAYFRHYLPQLGQAVLLPLTILLVVFPLDWLTAVIFLFTAPLIPFFMILIGKAAENQTERQWRLLSRLNGHLLEVLQGLKTLKAFGLSEQQGRVVRSVSERYAEVTLGVLRIAFLSALALELLTTISTAIIAVQIGLRLLDGGIPFSEALFVLIIAPEFYFPLRQLGAAFHSGMEGIAAAVSIRKLSNAASGRGPVIPDEPAQPVGYWIEFKDVTVKYEGRDQPALDGVSFLIPEGKQTSLIGASGAGKTTVFSLLLGFFPPNSGSLSVGNHDLASLDLEAYRQQIGWVPQFPYLFNASLRENIRLARPDAAEEQIREAARLANADSFILKFKDGYDTLIGERGARLSGGQAQRIAIARAFLRDTRLLLLDEPATGLDPGNEAVIQAALAQLKQGRTVVQIAHHLSTVQNCDWVIGLREGRVVQTGPPNDLIQSADFLREIAGSRGRTG